MSKKLAVPSKGACLTVGAVFAGRAWMHRTNAVGRLPWGVIGLGLGVAANACDARGTGGPNRTGLERPVEAERGDAAPIGRIGDGRLRWVSDGGGSYVVLDDGGALPSYDASSLAPVMRDSGLDAAIEITRDAGAARSLEAESCETGGCAVATAEDLLIAFIGDQGDSDDSDEVLELIAKEGAQAVVHNGDFDYVDDPEAWEARINRILGADYPYFAIIGNHDAAAWNGEGGYAEKIAARHARVPEMQCEGELGVRANCVFRGLHLVESCIGTDELGSRCDPSSPEQLEFIEQSLVSSPAVFKICNWHKNQHDMQVGGKRDQVGWEAYRLCMDAGALVATGHQHCYARTLNLTDVGNASNGHGAVGPYQRMTLRPGQNFVFVSGLAGRGIRDYQSSHDEDTWWASYYAGGRWLMNGAPQLGEANFGALFIRFHVDGDPRKARAYFKDVAGRIADEFTIEVR